MTKNPYQKKIFQRKNLEEISYVDFFTKTFSNRVFFQLRAYGETRLSGDCLSNVNAAPKTYFSLEFIMEGTCRFLMDGKEYSLKKGDVFVWRAVSPLLQRVPPDCTLKKIYLVVDYNNLMNHLYELFAEDHFVLHIRNMDRVLHFLDEIKKQVTTGGDFISEDLSMLIYALLLEIDKDRKNREISEEYSRIVSSIEFSPERYHNIEILLADFQISRYALTRFFRKHLNTTPMEYVIRKRLGKACWHLEYQNTSVAAIATLCGFRYVTFFNREFKKHYGMTPTQFRMNCRTQSSS